MTSSTRKSSKSRSSSKTQDAIALLRADHRTVEELFDEYEKARSSSKKEQLIDDICRELTIHAQLEEEIFYPAVQSSIKDKSLVPEAQVEHETVKSLIEQIQGMSMDDEMFDATVKVLSEYVKHHVKEEQGEMFPQVKSSRLDLTELGARLAERKSELVAEQTEVESY